LHSFEVFADVGVGLLMVSIGVEFSIPDLMRVKWVALGGGPIGTASAHRKAFCHGTKRCEIVSFKVERDPFFNGHS
jgi:hypothetical protein